MGGTEDNPYALLESRLGYVFADRARLETALTHKSYLNENASWGRPDNERLEFLGDAVIDLAVGHLLMDAAPERNEGELSKTRAAIVNELGLADVAGELGLGEWLFLGRGEEQSGGRRKPSVLADACEALVAAVYLDGGFDAAFAVVKRIFGLRVASAREAGLHDFKTRLQERAARRRLSVRYLVVSEHGPDHDKTFEIAVHVGDREYAHGVGKTKKEAEQRAAETALSALAGESGPT
ncbi:MAG TPA: ribonuclease III [Polyangia bacterium]